MTKSQRATLWLKSGLERKRDKEIEEHLSWIFKRIILGSLSILVLIYYFQEEVMKVYGYIK